MKAPSFTPERFVAKIEEHGIIPVEEVQLDGAPPLSDADRQFARYAQVVEAEVPMTAASVRALLPNRSEVMNRFVGAWENQETQHGVILGAVLNHYGIAPLTPREEVPQGLQLAGKLARISPGFHDILDWLYPAEGATAERTTANFYQTWRDSLKERGNRALTRVANLIIVQELPHFSAYRAFAHEKYHQLRPWQREVARRILIATEMPVGTKVGKRNRDRQAEFGHTTDLLMKDQGVTDVAAFLGNIREVVTAMAGTTAHTIRRYEECLEAYREQAA